MVGGKKACLDSTAIVHPVSGALVVSRNNIKEISLEYCKNTLRNNVPLEGYYDHIQTKIIKVKEKLIENDGDCTVTKNTFDCVLAKLKKVGEEKL